MATAHDIDFDINTSALDELFELLRVYNTGRGLELLFNLVKFHYYCWTSARQVKEGFLTVDAAIESIPQRLSSGEIREIASRMMSISKGTAFLAAKSRSLPFGFTIHAKSYALLSVQYAQTAEELFDLATAMDAEREGEPPVPWEKLKAELDLA